MDRSRLMSRIRSKDTSPELILRRVLWFRGIRYRKNVKGLPGTPDIVLTRYRIAIFVDGEFWHGHNWPDKKNRLKTNREFWIKKIERNMARDVRVNEDLKQLGYTTIRFWSARVKAQPQICADYVVGLIEAVKLSPQPV